MIEILRKLSLKTILIFYKSPSIQIILLRYLSLSLHIPFPLFFLCVYLEKSSTRE